MVLKLATSPLKILLVEDNPADARLTRELLLEAGNAQFELDHLERLTDAMNRVAEVDFDAVLLDLSLTDAHGLESVVRMRDHAPHLPIIVLSGLADEATAVDALANGAQDYLVKGQGDGFLVARAVRYAIERKRIQQQLVEEISSAELANRAKSEFLANMSHELRTPLNAIIGFSEIIKDEAFGPAGNSVYKDYALHIFESGSHLLEIINDLLDLSRIEAGRVTLAESSVNIPEVINACQRVIGERAHIGKVALVCNVPPDLPPLWADERMLKQILINMLSNAVKFTPEGGTVTVGAEFDREGGLVLTVSDTGIGIAEDDIPRAMSPFLQVENPLNRRFPGTGLGLPLTKSLVELHGGTFDLTSTLKVGTKVAMRFGPERVRYREPMVAQVGD